MFTFELTPQLDISALRHEGKLYAINGGRFTDCPYESGSQEEYFWIDGFWSV